MKKLIWIFGTPGSGRKTLIKNIINNKESVRDLLEIDTDNIDYYEYINDKSKNIEEFDQRRLRISSLTSYINSFVEKNKDYLIIYGINSDLEDKYDSCLKMMPIIFPELDQELVYLLTEDYDLLYERLTNTEWFKSNPRNEKKHPRLWLDVALKYFRKQAQSYKEDGFDVKEIDTTNGYKLILNEKQKTR